MAPPRNRKTAAAAPAASGEKPLAAVVIEPPATTRARTSTVEEVLVDDMLDNLNNGAAWVSNGLDYPSARDASNASVVHRRALVRALGGDPNNADDPTRKRVGSRKWQTTGTDGKKTGRWVFALSLNGGDSPS